MLTQLPFVALIVAWLVACAGLSFAQGQAPATQPSAAIQIGKPAPDFTLPNQDDKPVFLSDYRGQWLVLYFYPKDMTPGCTTEACEFTDGVEQFRDLGATVVGVSADDPATHRKFIEKEKLKITLLSDAKRQVMREYGAWEVTEKDGKQTGRVNRSTVVISPQGVVAHHWPRVSPRGHAEEVRKVVAQLKADAEKRNRS